MVYRDDVAAEYGDVESPTYQDDPVSSGNGGYDVNVISPMKSRRCSCKALVAIIFLAALAFFGWGKLHGNEISSSSVGEPEQPDDGSTGFFNSNVGVRGSSSDDTAHENEQVPLPEIHNVPEPEHAKPVRENPMQEPEKPKPKPIVPPPKPKPVAYDKPPASTKECVDDSAWINAAGKTCANWMANLGRINVHVSRCNGGTGIFDKHGEEYKVMHFCKESCGMCGDGQWRCGDHPCTAEEEAAIQQLEHQKAAEAAAAVAAQKEQEAAELAKKEQQEAEAAAAAMQQQQAAEVAAETQKENEAQQQEAEATAAAMQQKQAAEMAAEAQKEQQMMEAAGGTPQQEQPEVIDNSHQTVFGSGVVKGSGDEEDPSESGNESAQEENAQGSASVYQGGASQQEQENNVETQGGASGMVINNENKPFAEENNVNMPPGDMPVGEEAVSETIPEPPVVPAQGSASANPYDIVAPSQGSETVSESPIPPTGAESANSYANAAPSQGEETEGTIPEPMVESENAPQDSASGVKSEFSTEEGNENEPIGQENVSEGLVHEPPTQDGTAAQGSPSGVGSENSWSAAVAQYTESNKGPGGR